jgi:hypothetical protein
VEQALIAAADEARENQATNRSLLSRLKWQRRIARMAVSVLAFGMLAFASGLLAAILVLQFERAICSPTSS